MGGGVNATGGHFNLETGHRTPDLFGTDYQVSTDEKTGKLVHTPRLGNTKWAQSAMTGVTSPPHTIPADPAAGTDSLDGLGESMGNAGITGEHPSPTNTTQMDLSQFTGGKVGVKDTTQLIEQLKGNSSDGTDENGNIIRGKAEVHGG
jgi:hypothetical protein